MMIRLLIADDERLEREALAEMVTRRFVEHEIVLEEAENGRKAAHTAILWGGGPHPDGHRDAGHERP